MELAFARMPLERLASGFLMHVACLGLHIARMQARLRRRTADAAGVAARASAADSLSAVFVRRTTQTVDASVACALASRLCHSHWGSAGQGRRLQQASGHRRESFVAGGSGVVPGGSWG